MALDRPPDNIIEVPYWTLRNIKKTIIEGGFITTSIYVPKKVWNQSDVKFTGLSAKSTAFQIIVNVLTANVDTLYMSNDITSLELADSSFAAVEDEFVAIQNQLAKSFNYIKETHLSEFGISTEGANLETGEGITLTKADQVHIVVRSILRLQKIFFHDA